jgi:hypothetical protein
MVRLLCFSRPLRITLIALLCFALPLGSQTKRQKAPKRQVCFTVGFLTEAKIQSKPRSLKEFWNLPLSLRKVPLIYILKAGRLVPAAYGIVGDGKLRLPALENSLVLKIASAPELIIKRKGGLFEVFKSRVSIEGSLLISRLQEIDGHAASLRSRKIVSRNNTFQKELFYGINLPKARLLWGFAWETELESRLKIKERKVGILGGFRIIYDSEEAIKGYITKIGKLDILEERTILKRRELDIYLAFTLNSPLSFSLFEPFYRQWDIWYLEIGIKRAVRNRPLFEKISFSGKRGYSPYISLGTKMRIALKVK